MPQTQAFCAGLWRHWDDKITTLPGLYIVAVGLHRAGLALHSLFPASMPESVCSPSFLRQVNHLFAALTVVIVALILRHLHGPAVAASHSLWLWSRALFIALFPPLSFFYSLYYTDAGSSFTVLLTYYLSLRASAASRPSPSAPSPRLAAGFGWQLAAGAAGAAAVLFRQTNAVWVALICAIGILSDLSAPPTPAQPAEEGGARAEWLSGAREGLKGKRRGGKSSSAESAHLPSIPAPAPGSVSAAQPLSLLDAPLGAYRSALSLARNPLPLVRRWPLLSVLLAFALFLVANGGVVVGDKANHQPARHLAQLCYMAAVAVSGVAPSALVCAGRAVLSFIRTQPTTSQQRPSTRAWVRPLLWAAALCAGAAVCVRWGTLAHPFLLADNRHLPFYLWRRLISPFPAAKYLYLPLYAAAAALADASLARAARAGGALATVGQPLARAGFYLCTAAALVPSPLIEPRYFVVPWLWVALHQPAWTPAPGKARRRWRESAVDLVWLVGAVVVNVAAWAVFLYKPFSWPDGSVARFMW